MFTLRRTGILRSRRFCRTFIKNKTLVEWHVPLTDEEKSTLNSRGWVFLNDNYIFIPDDYDGGMAFGMNAIRRVLKRIVQQNKI